MTSNGIPSVGAILFSRLAAEFGGVPPIRLGQFYAAVGFVPGSGARLKLSTFRGKVRNIVARARLFKGNKNASSAVVSSSGKIHTWGRNDYGQVGNGNTSTLNTPTEISNMGSLTNKAIVSVAAGTLYVIALDATGVVHGWGYNGYGQIGNGNTSTTYIPTIASGSIQGKMVTSIAAGSDTSYAIDSSGGVHAWGYNAYGQVGNNNTSTVNTPTYIGDTGSLNGRFVTNITAGYYHAHAVDSSGSVHSWGYNHVGQLGDNTTTQRNMPVSIAGAMVGKTIRLVSSGWYHSLALDSNGGVYSWGDNTYGALGTGDNVFRHMPEAITTNGSLAARTIVDLAAGYYHSMALDSSGGVHTIGYNNYGQLGIGATTPAWTATPVYVNLYGSLLQKNVVAISASEYTCQAIDSSGGVHAWGYNGYGQLGDGTNTNRWEAVQIASEDTNAGSVRSNELTTFTLETITEATAIPASSTSIFVSWTGGKYAMVKVSWTGGETGFVTGTSIIVTGLIPNTSYTFTVTPYDASRTATTPATTNSATTYDYHVNNLYGHYSVFNTVSGNVFVSGAGNSYQLGNNSSTQINSFTSIMSFGSLSGVSIKQVTSGNSHTVALDTSGSVHAWGYNGYYNIGNNSTTSVQVPILVNFGSLGGNTALVITSVFAGDNQSFAIDASGIIHGWGRNDYYQIDSTASTRQVPVSLATQGALNGKFMVMVATHYLRTAAIDKDGAVYSWGYGYMGNNTTSSYLNPAGYIGNWGSISGRKIVSILGSYSRTLCLDDTGKVHGWGTGSYSGEINGSLSSAQVPVMVTTGSFANKVIVDIGIGYYHSVALDSSGGVHTWGMGSNGQIGDNTLANRDAPVDITNFGSLQGKRVVSVGCSMYNTWAYDSNTNLHAWGYNATGQLGVGQTTIINYSSPMIVANMIAVNVASLSAVVSTRTAGVNWTGSTYAKGLVNGVPSGNIKSSTYTASYLRPNTTYAVTITGTSFDGSADANTLSMNVTTLNYMGMESSTSENMFVISKSGALIAWGNNNYGQLGTGDNVNRFTMTVISNGTLTGKAIKSVACGAYHALAVDTSGGLHAWGTADTSYYQLGNNTTGSFYTPFSLSEFGSLTSVTVERVGKLSIYSSFVIDTSGVVHCWGMNSSYQLGLNTTAVQRVPTICNMGSLNNAQVLIIAGGDSHTLAIDMSGFLHCWGVNSSYQIPRVSTSTIQVPVLSDVPVFANMRFTDVACGYASSIVSTTAGTVYAFGWNGSYQLGTNTSSTGSFTPVLVLGSVSAAYIVAVSCTNSNAVTALDSSGNMHTWGLSGQTGVNTASQIYIPLMVNVGSVAGIKIAFAASASTSSFAIDVDGGIHVWGSGSSGQLGTNNTSLNYLTSRNLTSLEIGDPGTLTVGAVTTTSVELSWTKNAFVTVSWAGGSIPNLYGKYCLVGDLNPDTQYTFTVTPSDIQGTTGTALSTNVTTLATHLNMFKSYGTTTAFISPSGELYLCGSNSYGQLGIGENTTQIRAVIQRLSDFSVQSKVITKVVGSQTGMFALDSSGGLHVWGWNGYGQLGNNQSSGSTLVPTSIASAGSLNGKTVTDIGCGTNHTLAIDSLGALHSWGNNDYYQLPYGNNTNGLLPKSAVTGSLVGRQFKRVIGGYYYSYALDVNGTLHSWGYHNYTYLGDNNASNSSKVTPGPTNNSSLIGKVLADVSTTFVHTLALDTDGLVHSWGSNGNGQLGDNTVTSRNWPVNISNSGSLAGTKIVAIHAGSSHSLTLDSSGQIHVFGRHAVGELGLGTNTINRLIPVPLPFFQGKTVVSIGGGYDYNTVADNSGVIYAWGSNGMSQLALSDNSSVFTPGVITAMTSSGVVDNVVVSNVTVYTAVVSWEGTATTRVTWSSGSSELLSGNSFSAIGLQPNTSYTFTVSPEITGVSANAVTSEAVVTLPPYYDAFQTYGNNTILISPSGALYICGSNSNGQLAIGENVSQGRATFARVNTGPMFNKVIRKAAGGQGQIIALDVSGGIYAWGGNGNGELGNNSTSMAVSPVQITTTGSLSGKAIVDITCGANHTMAIDSNGGLHYWGYGVYYQLPDGSASSTSLPTSTVTGSLVGRQIRSIAAGEYHSYAVDTSGLVHAWGYHAGYILGDATSSSYKTTPATINHYSLTGQRVIMVATSSQHTLALDSTGTIHSWGYNNYGEIGNGSFTSYSYPISIKSSGTHVGRVFTIVRAGIYFSMAIDSNNKLHVWGYGLRIGVGHTGYVYSPILSPTLQNKTILSAGDGGTHGFAFDDSGAVYVWGQNSVGQLGIGNNVTQSLLSPQLITALVPTEIADVMVTEITATTALVTWVGNAAVNVTWTMINGIGGGASGLVSGTSYIVTGLTPNKSYSFTVTPTELTGAAATPMLAIDATTFEEFSTTLPSYLVAAKLEGNTGAIISPSGTLYLTGHNSYGQLGIGQNTTQSRSSFAAVTNGSLNGVLVERVVGGMQHMLAIDTSGRLHGWGYNDYGQVGNNSYSVALSPVNISSTGSLNGKTIIDFSAGYDHSLAVDSSGMLHGWGYNGYYQLNSTGSTLTLPTAISMAGSLVGKQLRKVTGSYYYSFGIDASGGLHAWGYDNYLYLGVNTSTYSYSTPVAVNRYSLVGKSVVAVESSWYHTVAIDTTGQVHTWGSNSYGELGDNTQTSRNYPTNITGSGSTSGKTIVTACAGEYYSMLMDTSGDVHVFGYGANGRLGLGNNTNVLLPTLVSSLQGKNIISVGNGINFSYALSYTGVVYAWGVNGSGQLGTGDFVESRSPKFVTTMYPSTISDPVVSNVTITTAYVSWTGNTVVTVTWPGGSSGMIEGTSYQILGLRQRTKYAFTVTPVSLYGAGGSITTEEIQTLEDYLGDSHPHSASHYHVLTSLGYVASWGNGNYNAIGDGGNTNRATPVGVTIGSVGGRAIVTVRSGYSYCIALDSTGKVHGWGYNNYGQVGNATSSTIQSPIEVSQFGTLIGRTVTTISTGYYHSGAVDTSGLVHLWGYNGYYQINNTGSSQYIPVINNTFAIAGKFIVKIATGTEHTTVIDNTGAAYAWGYGSYGQLGEGGSTRSTPFSIASQGSISGRVICEIEAGYYHTIFLDTQGVVHACGYNSRGEIGNNSTSVVYYPVNVGNSGSLQGRSIIRICVGYQHTIALDTSGVVHSWGSNGYGQVGDNTTTDKHLPISLATRGSLVNRFITTISAASYGTMAIDMSANLHGWGNIINSNNIMVPTVLASNSASFGVISPSSFSPVTNITAPTSIIATSATSHSAIVMWKGGLYASLKLTSSQGNDYGSVRTSPYTILNLTPSTTYTFTLTPYDIAGVANNAITSSSLTTFSRFGGTMMGAFSMLMTEGGLLYSWGANSNGQLGDGTTEIKNLPNSIANSGSLSGKVIRRFAAGANHAIAVDSSGTVHTWGTNGSSQLGNNSTASSLIPIDISTFGSLSGAVVRQVASGNSHCIALDTSGSVHSWGDNSNYQLGLNTSTTIGVPTRITLGSFNNTSSPITFITAGHTSSFALDSSGGVHAWGHNGYYNLGNGSSSNGFVPLSLRTSGYLQSVNITMIAASDYYTLALSDQGRVYYWGYDAGYYTSGGYTTGYVTAPYNISVYGSLQNKLIVQIATGRYHVIALDSTGLVHAWGAGSNGQVGNNVAGTTTTPTLVSLNGSLHGRTIAAISAAEYTSFALDNTGGIHGWGINSSGQLGDATTVSQRLIPVPIASLTTVPVSMVICEFITSSSVNVRWTGGTYFVVKVSWAGGESDFIPGRTFTVTGLHPATQYEFTVTPYNIEFTAGTPVTASPLTTRAAFSGPMKGNHTMVSTPGRVPYVWGNNSYGQLGDNSLVDRISPISLVGAGSLAGKTVSEITTGFVFTVVLDTLGGVHAWGRNNVGQLGDNSTSDKLVPVAITGGTLSEKTVMGIATGEAFTIAVDTSGGIHAWGDNTYGQLGDNTTTSHPLPDSIPGLSTRFIREAAAGANHGVACDSSGIMYTWGRNENGQLGINSNTAQSLVPVSVMTHGSMVGRKVVSVFAAGSRTIAIDGKRGFHCWGQNASYELGDNTTTLKSVPINMTLFGSLADKAIAQFAMGESHTIALDSSGGIHTWGGNSWGQIGDGTTTTRQVPFAIGSYGTLSSKVIQGVAAGATHSMALDTSGAVHAWGRNDVGQFGNNLVHATAQVTPNVVTSFTTFPVTTITHNSITDSSVNLTWNGGFSDRMRIVWSGSDSGFIRGNRYTVLGLNPNTSYTFTFVPSNIDTTEGVGANSVAIRTNFTFMGPTRGDHAGTLTFSGGLSVWGRNAARQLGDNTTTTRRAPRSIKAIGSLTGKTITFFTAGAESSYALDTSGNVHAWGTGTHGQLNRNSITAQNVPLQVSGNGTLAAGAIFKITAGSHHVLALDVSGNVHAWGRNDSGQLGVNTNVNALVATIISSNGSLSGRSILGFAAGTNHSVAYDALGEVHTWGSNTNGKLGNNTTTASWVPINVSGMGSISGKIIIEVAAGDEFTLAVDKAGGVHSWGDNASGQLGDNTTAAKSTAISLSGTGVLAGKIVTMVAAGGAHSIAMDSSGSVFVWGSNSAGQLGLGNNTTVLVPTQVTGGSFSGKRAFTVTATKTSTTVRDTDDGIHAWGDNTYGQIGDNTSSGRQSPVVVTYLDTRNVSITAVNITAYSAFVKWSGGQYVQARVAWSNSGPQETSDFYRTADPTYLVTGLIPRTTYYPYVYCYDLEGVMRSNTYTSFTTLDMYSLGTKGEYSAIISGTNLYTWGAGTYGRLGNNSTSTMLVPTSIMSFGSLSGKAVVSVAGGYLHMIAMDSSGGVHTWGYNTNYQLGNGNTTQFNYPISIAESGSLYGRTALGVSAGEYHCCIIDVSGTIHSWGLGTSGQLGDNSAISKQVPINLLDTGSLQGKFIYAIHTGWNHSLAIDNTGVVHAWGLNNTAQLGLGDNVYRYLPSSLAAAGSLSGKQVIAVSAGSNFSLALDSSGIIHAWGDNSYYQIGNNTTTLQTVPVAVQNGAIGTNVVVSISAGQFYAMAVGSGGHLYGWGYNGNYQLGTGSTSTMQVPWLIQNVASISGHGYASVICHMNHTLMIDTNRGVYGVGYNPNYELGINTSTTYVTTPVIVSALQGYAQGQYNTTVINKTSTSLTLQWNTAPSAYRVVTVYNGDGTIFNTSTNLRTNTYSLSSMTPSTYYYAYVYGHDIAGNAGGQGNITWYTQAVPPTSITTNVLSNAVWLRLNGGAYYYANVVETSPNQRNYNITLVNNTSPWIYLNNYFSYGNNMTVSGSVSVANQANENVAAVSYSFTTGAADPYNYYLGRNTYALQWFWSGSISRYAYVVIQWRVPNSSWSSSGALYPNSASESQTYTITSLSANYVYETQITAYNSAGVANNVTYSTSISTLPIPPTITATRDSNNYVTLNRSGGNYASFYIYGYFYTSSSYAGTYAWYLYSTDAWPINLGYRYETIYYYVVTYANDDGSLLTSPTYTV